LDEKIYATPQADLAESTERPRVLLYSPTQVACGTLGGPVALIYFLMANFETLGDEALKKKTLQLGIAFIIALVATIPFLPDSLPSSVFTVAYIIVARHVAENYQMTKADILASEVHDFHSNWRVFGLGLLCLAASFFIVLGPLTLLALADVL